MLVGIVGGLGRAESLYRQLATEAGHEVAFHDGDVGGRGAHALAQLVERCDVVVLVTDVNSHGAVRYARARLKKVGRSPLLVRRFGLERFSVLLDALSVRSAV